MKTKYIMLLFCLFALLIPSSASERGVYIYDEVNKISTDSELSLNAYLWKLDQKTGYENVVVIPKEKMDIEQMEDWFNSHGVGKKDKNNGFAIFIFPDNTVFGMIGKGHDTIAVPYLTTSGKKSLQNLKDDPVFSIFKLLNSIGTKLDQPSITEKALTLGYVVSKNIDLIVYWITTICLLLLLIQQRDGFQMSDLILPGIFIFFSLIFIGISMIPDSAFGSVNEEFGVITSTNTDSYTFIETHSYPCGKNTCYRTEVHTMYTNDVKIKSYDLREYEYRFSSRDSKWSWSMNVDRVLAIGISENNNLYSVSTNINDNSGGITERYGTWIQSK